MIAVIRSADTKSVRRRPDNAMHALFMEWGLRVEANAERSAMCGPTSKQQPESLLMELRMMESARSLNHDVVKQ